MSGELDHCTAVCMNAWGVSNAGLVRKENQDSFCIQQITPECLLLTICDGMGGARAGGVASEIAAEEICAAVTELTKRVDNPAQILVDAVSRANEVVYDRACSDPECEGMGTTMVICLVYDRNCLIANVGDSRAYRISPDGIRLVTQDHSLVEDLVRRGEITEEQARNHPHKNLITRALGATEAVTADFFVEPCTEGDYLLLCSDGLTKVLTDQEIYNEVISGGEPDECCQRLLDTVLSRGAPDNVSVVLLQM